MESRIRAREVAADYGGEKGGLKDWRAAAINAGCDALRREAWSEQGEESDDEPKTDEQRHPAGA